MSPVLYFDSRVRFCPRGHDTWRVGRYPASCRCRICTLEDQRAYYAKRKSVSAPDAFRWPRGISFWQRKCESCRTVQTMPRDTYTCGFCIEVPREERRVAV